MSELFFINQGRSYIEFIADYVNQTNAGSYFEIGSNLGNSLLPIAAKTVAVDPQFKIEQNVIGRKRVCMFFQMNSDDFFAEYKLSDLFQGPLDVAFLDGMHQYEYLLRDFMNTEKHSSRNSTIILHDCLPTRMGMTTRHQKDRWWTGDVWKVVPILQKYRPDLKLAILDCRPTGLVLISNLDPQQTTLDENYHRIVEEYAPGEADEAALRTFFRATPSRKVDAIKDLPAFSREFRGL